MERETTANESQQDRDDAPYVSVIIPAYNVAPYIGAALASVFAQTFEDFEVFVVNDGSPDTPALERALESYRARINYLRQENRGPGAARNVAVRAARGRFVAFLDADDTWHSDYLAEQARALRADPSLDLIYADAELFGDSPLAGKTFMQTHPSAGEVTVESLIDLRTVPITSCVVARRRALLAAGLFDERFFYAEDFHLWTRLAHAGHRLTYQRRVLARHRVHAESLTADKVRHIEVQLAVYRDLAETLALSTLERGVLERQTKRAAAQLALWRGKRELVEGRFGEAARSLTLANGYYRSAKLRAALLALRVAPRLLRRVYNNREDRGPRPTAAACKSGARTAPH